MKCSNYFLVFLMVPAIGLISGPSFAGSLIDQGIKSGRGGLGARPSIDSPQHQLNAPHRLSAREAIAIAEQRYGGRAVGAKKVSTARGSAYRVRILQKNGKIKNVIIDNQ